MEQILIYGFHQQAKQLCFYMEHEGQGKVAAFVADRPFLPERRELMGRPIVAFDEVSALYPPPEYKFAVSFAYQHMIRDREEKSRMCVQAGYQLFTFISRYAAVFAKSVGEGVIIYPGCNIACGVELGDGNFLETGVTVAHDTKIGDWNFFAPAAVVCGDAFIGDHNFIGANATVIGSAFLGSGVLVGAGAVVRRAEDNGVYLPARTVPWHGKSSEIKI